VFDMVRETELRLVQPEQETPAGEAVWVAQLLAGGNDPTPQLERARVLLLSLGGLAGLLKAPPEQLKGAGLLDGQQVALLTTVQRVVGSAQAAGQPVIGSFRALERFLRTRPVGAGIAVTRALLIGEHHYLKADVILARGGGPWSLKQRQELIRSCLEHRVPDVILARAAPQPEPSGPDRAREANVVACSLEMVGMRLLDYVLVGPSAIVRVRWCQPSAVTALMS
jgi:DNA repair protein RadC